MHCAGAGCQRGASQRGEGSVGQASISSLSTGVVSEKTQLEKAYDIMLEKIEAAMSAGQYEIAVIQWLQTQQEQKFFTRYFSRFNPDFVQDLSPLLLLSLGATISMQLDDELLPLRITWLETVVTAFQALVSSGTLVRSLTSRSLLPLLIIS